MPAFVRSVMRASFNLMPSSRAKDESRPYCISASRTLHYLEPLYIHTARYIIIMLVPYEYPFYLRAVLI